MIDTVSPVTIIVSDRLMSLPDSPTLQSPTTVIASDFNILAHVQEVPFAVAPDVPVPDEIDPAVATPFVVPEKAVAEKVSVANKT